MWVFSFYEYRDKTERGLRFILERSLFGVGVGSNGLSEALA